MVRAQRSLLIGQHRLEVLDSLLNPPRILKCPSEIMAR